MHLLVWGPSRVHRELAEFCKAELINEYEKRTEGRPLTFDETWTGESFTLCRVQKLGSLVESVASSVLISSLVRIDRIDTTLKGAMMGRKLVLHAYNVDEDCSVLANRQLKNACNAANLQILTEGIHGTEEEPSSAFLINGRYLVGTILYEPSGNTQSSSVVERGPTTLDPLLARLSLQFANIFPGSIVLDPCCGSGSIPITAHRDYHTQVLFSDVQEANVSLTKSATGIGDGLVADVMRLRFRENSIDAIVTDIPYGHREEIRGCACEADMLKHLAETAGSMLVPGGRLVVWTHAVTDHLREFIDSIGLDVLFLLKEKKHGLQRHLVVLKKDGVQRKWTQKVLLRTKEHIISNKALQRNLPYRVIRQQKEVLDVWRCAWLGDTASLEKYFQDGPGDANLRDDFGRTPLLFACGYGRMKAAIMLLNQGADPNMCDSKSKMNALHRAAARGHTEIIELLAQQQSIDLLATSACGQNAMHYCAQFGWTDSTEALLRVLSQRGEAVACLVAADQEGRMPLHLACQWNKHRVVRQLLETGIYNPNEKTACQSQWRPAHFATRWGHQKVLDVLCSFGADLDLPSGPPYYSTPMQEAVRWGRSLNYN